MTDAEGAAEAGAPPSFGDYARYYDLLYRDKDYDAEAAYVARAIRMAAPEARSILELGAGTGGHGRLLAARGFDVVGIERSRDMVAQARSAAPASAAGSFTCALGDARSVRLERCFDAVVALFHVVSYQTTERDLRATFATAACHLAPGGVFLFDVWHGPAVLAQKPERRVKRVAADGYEVVRTAHPELDADARTVKVAYEMVCRDGRSGETRRFSEDHVMRYLFPDEIVDLAASAGLRVLRSEEFLTGEPPSAATWGVAYLLRK